MISANQQKNSVKSAPNKPPKVTVLLDNIPAELKLFRFLVWGWVKKVKKGDELKWDKPPFDAKTGERGSSTNSATWRSYDEAVAALPRFDGLGIPLGQKGLNLVAFDLDNCRDPKTGEIAPWALEMIDEIDTYTETSPSGEGIRMLIFGTYDKSEFRAKVGDKEVYRDGRYVTVTGNVFGGKKEIRSIENDELQNILEKHFAKPTAKTRASEPSNDATKAKAATNDRIRQAFLACLKVEIKEDEQDGSGRMIRYARQCHRAGLDADDYLKVVRMLDIQHPFPAKYRDEEIKDRYEDAKTQTEFGEALKVYEQSDYGVAMRVRDFCNGSILYIPEWHRWLAWNGQAFEFDRHGKLIDAIVAVSRQMMQETPTLTGDAKEDEKAAKAWRSHCMHYQSGRGIETVERLSRSYMAEDYRNLDKRNYLFYAENGTVNIQADGEIKLQPHCRSNMNTMISPVPFIPGAKCPRWLQFVSEITDNNEALSLYLQKVVGYCLTAIAAQEFFILHGGGNNGKGVFTRTLGKLLGDFGGIVSQDLITTAGTNQHPTQFAYLYNKRCVIATESDEGRRLNEAQVKMLTGGDTIQCRRMREDFWEFPPTHKLLLTTNSVPTIRGTDHGIWRRIKLIPFGVIFEKPDTELDRKLEAELPGVLQWALMGYRYLRFEGWAEPQCVIAAKENYRADMDVVTQFIEDKCTLSKDHETAFSVLYQSCKLYCEQNGHAVVSSRKLAVDLDKLGVTKGGNGHCRTRKGIALKSEFEAAK